MDRYGEIHLSVDISGGDMSTQCTVRGLTFEVCEDTMDFEFHPEWGMDFGEIECAIRVLECLARKWGVHITCQRNAFVLAADDGENVHRWLMDWSRHYRLQDFRLTTPVDGRVIGELSGDEIC